MTQRPRSTAHFYSILPGVSLRLPGMVPPLVQWKRSGIAPGRPRQEQPPGDWTERQRALFRGASERGESRVVLIASDSPQLPEKTVAEAFTLLDSYELAPGPVADGGYYLIGMRGWHDVLRGVAMSTGSVLDELLRAALSLGVSARTHSLRPTTWTSSPTSSSSPMTPARETTLPPSCALPSTAFASGLCCTRAASWCAWLLVGAGAGAAAALALTVAMLLLRGLGVPLPLAARVRPLHSAAPGRHLPAAGRYLVGGFVAGKRLGLNCSSSVRSHWAPRSARSMP